MPIKYDLILKGGEVLDPSLDLRARRDVAFKDGRVAAVVEGIPPQEGTEAINVAGRLVVPGLIDFHGHYAYKISVYRADPDPTNLPLGITTAVDAGTTGWMTFPGFRAYVIERVETRLYAFIHLSSIGTILNLGLRIPDLEDFRLARAEETIKCIEENRDLVLGVKVRLTPSGTTLKNAVPALQMARQVADQTGTRVMVHVMESPLPLAQVFDYLEAGDIATHIFHSDTHSILDERGRIRSEAWDAYKSGVIFDTGCFARHFSIPVSRVAIESGMLPHTLSTDAVGTDHPRRSKNYDLLGVMSIYLSLGMSLEEVIRGVTATPASCIGREDLGTLRVGAIGDAAVLELEQGEFAFTDALETEIIAERRFIPFLTVKDGRTWRPPARSR